METKAGQMTEEEEFEFRARLEAEVTQSSEDPVVADSTKVPKTAKKKGWADELDPTMRTILQMSLPAAGALAAAPFTGGASLPAILAMEGLGSLGGEALAQVTGISEPSMKEQALALLLPGVGRSVGGALANLPRMIPGFGDALKAGMTKEMRELPEKLLPGSSKELYEQLGKQVGPNLRITNFPELSKAIKELKIQTTNIPWGNLQARLKANNQGELFEQIKQSIQGVPPTVGMAFPTVGGKPFKLSGFPPTMQVTQPGRPAGLTFEEAKAATEGLGRIISSTSDDAERGIYKKLYNSLLTDLEKAPAPASGDLTLWKQARQIYKTEKARFALAEQTEKAITTKEGVDIIDPNKIVKWLRTSDEVRSRVSPSEYRAIVNEYRNLAAVAGKNMGRIVSILGGWVAGGNASGALAGYVGGEALAKAMMSERGRKAVRAMVGDPSRSNFRRVLAVSGAAAGGALNIDEGDDDEAMY